MRTIWRFLVLVTVVAVCLPALATACGDGLGGPEKPSTTTGAIAMPDVVGHNAAVAVDELKKLGFTNVELGTVDGRPAVVLPQNWTVKEQSAKPGDLLATDAMIVLGCARNDDDHWPFT
jgi:hypothetical protein